MRKGREGRKEKRGGKEDGEGGGGGKARVPPFLKS